MEPVLDLKIDLPPRGSRALLRSLHRQLRAAIVEGRLCAGLRLPSTRAFARTHGISRNSAIAAYDLLLSEGYVTTRPGGGTFVAQAVAHKKEPPASAPAANTRGRISAQWRDVRAWLGAETASRYRYDFALGLPEKSEFPFEVWRRLSARALRNLSKASATYAEAQGRAGLREAIAQHVSFARAVACNPDDVVVTSGAQQAFDLLARVLVTAGRTVVALEDPGYPPLRRAFVAAGAKVAAVPVDAGGIIVERLPRQARIVCVTPSHQFPLGMALSMQRRRSLLEFAQRQGALIIEDDYDSEFRHADRPVDALQTLDRDELVFYVGTFSKSLFPALRLGFVVAPGWARDALIAAKQAADWHSAVLAQDTLASFIAEGHLARHVRKMRRVYGGRRSALLEALAEHGRGRIEVIPSMSGLHLAVGLIPRISAAALAQRAAEAGVRVQALDPFAIAHPVPNAVAFGFGVIPAERIEAAVARLFKQVR
ncbi:MAG TPA: PLP-dependent aminotransferase family protein [Burkholderiales bacterium]|nr:PLP-dependent aminotransferase family protein [Burkholderiales bacterium]